MSDSTNKETSRFILPETAPRHQNLARTIAAEIENGSYPVGSKLPTEFDLCKQFGASRHTVRAALDHLVRAGLIARKPRLGTVVKSRTVVQGYQLSVGHISDLMQFGADTSMQVLDKSLQTIGHDTTEQVLRAYVGQQWLFVRGLRHDASYEVPISYHEVWVHPDYRAVSGVQGHMTNSIFHLIEQQFGVAVVRVRQTIQSALPTEPIYRRLQIQPGTPCLWVRRAYYDGNEQLVELSLSVHPGDLFSYQMDLQRNQGS